MDVYLNGRMVPQDEAVIGVMDAGFQHAVGLFETLAVRNGRAFRAPAHVQRLVGSAKELGMGQAVDGQRLLEAIATTVAHNAVTEARLRLTVTPGAVSMLAHGRQQQHDDAQQPQQQQQATILAAASPPTVYDPRYFQEGITATVAAQAANPFDPTSGHKTLAYWPRLLRLRQAAGLGAGEVIHLTITNHLAGGAVSNLFLIRNGVLLTPPARGEEESGALPSPVLPGITRQAVLEVAEARGIRTERRTMAIDDLLDADEVFLTNASWHLLPVTKIEKKPIADGRVGPITTALREALLELIEQETAGDAPDGANPRD